MLTFRVAALKQAYVAGESFRLELTLENRGDTAVRVPHPARPTSWEPVYLVITADNELHGVFDPRRKLHGPSMALPSPSEATLLEIGPGQTWSDVIRVDGLIGLTKAGVYRIRGILRWEGIHAESNTVSFTFEELRLNGVGHGFWGNPPGSSIFFVWLHRREQGQVLFQNYFHEGHGDDGGVRSSDVIRYAEVGPEASGPFTQNTHHALGERLFHWAFFRDGEDLVALDSLTRERATFPLDAGETIVAPAFMDRDGTADVCTLARAPGGRSRLRTIRFVSPLARGPQPGRQLVAHELPGEALLAATAAERPDGSGLRHAAAVVLDGHVGVIVHHLAMDPGGAMERVEPRTLEWRTELEALGDAPAAMIAGEGGVLRLGFVLRDKRRARACVLFEATFGGEGGFRASEFELPSAPIAARIGYFEGAGGRIRGECLIWTEDSRVYAVSGGGVRVVRERVAEGEPRVLVVLGDASYLLMASPLRGLDLVEI
jgi:hypothetical protein